MKTYNISLKDKYEVEGGELECILADCPFDVPTPNWKRPAVVVVPGGAYWMVSKREGEPVANYFLAKGFQTFVLTYRCAPDGARYPEQLFELAAAVDFVKKHAEEYNVNPEEIFVVGFSAGGHLVADLSVEYSSVSEKMGQAVDCRPKAVGLGYPVISAEYGHVQSYGNLLNGYTDEAKAELMKTLNLDKVVTAETSPAFIWTTSEDTCVPPTNSLAFAAALSRNKVPFELHVYPNGVHGGSICSVEINSDLAYFKKNEQWLDDCASFFRLFTVEKF
jgi:acetyl esterase/lipase